MQDLDRELGLDVASPVKKTVFSQQLCRLQNGVWEKEYTVLGWYAVVYNKRDMTPPSIHMETIHCTNTNHAHFHGDLAQNICLFGMDIRVTYLLLKTEKYVGGGGSKRESERQNQGRGSRAPSVDNFPRLLRTLTSSRPSVQPM